MIFQNHIVPMIQVININFTINEENIFNLTKTGAGLNIKNEQDEWVIKGIASAAGIIYGNDVCNGN